MDDGCWLHLAGYKMARVLCISSQTVFGPVGNSAAAPALQASGHEVMQIPTVLLSNHPGLGKPAGQATSVEVMQAMFLALQNIRAFDDLAAVMTGYFSSAAQVIAAAKQIAALKASDEKLHVLVDPVMGDHGKLYVGEDVAEAIRDQLLPLATITTPNLFELGWLTGESDIPTAVSRLNISEVIVTSIPVAERLETQLHVKGCVFGRSIARRDKVPNGTGDFLAGCYLAERLTCDHEAAFEHAMTRLDASILRSAGRRILDVSPS
jgi:pyridoxine kinase